MCQSSLSNHDEGYADEFRGWYNWSGCNKCFDYCRWVGHCGSGGDPSIRTKFTCMKFGETKTSWWQCRKAGTSDAYSNNWFNPFDGNFEYKMCSGEGGEGLEA